jgi:hypothetical protein
MHWVIARTDVRRREVPLNYHVGGVLKAQQQIVVKGRRMRRPYPFQPSSGGVHG